MLMPSIFGENLFDDFFTPFYYDDKDEKKAEKKLYGRRAQNLLKTDIKEKPEGYELIVDVPGFKKDEVTAELNDGYITISAAKGLDKDEKDKKNENFYSSFLCSNNSLAFAIARDSFCSKSSFGGILVIYCPTWIFP